MGDLFNSSGEVCQICGKASTALQEICECGYHFRSKQIRDWTSTRKYLDGLKATDWRKELQIKKAIMKIQGWSLRKFAKHLGVSHGLARDIHLGEALEKYPQLCECKNKRHASNLLKSIEKRQLNPFTEHDEDSPFREEKELRDYLAENWDHTSLAGSWELVRPEYPTSVGNIDLFAKHKTDRRYLVVELKVSKTCDDVIGQILRYMGWVKLNLARGEDEKVEGLIVAPGIDEKTFCSLVDLKDVSVKLYRLREKTIQLEGLDEMSLYLLFKKILYLPVMKDFLEALKNGQKPDPRLSEIIKACS